MSDEYDIAIAKEPDGEILVHSIDCPYVRQLAKEGHEVATLLGCTKPLMPGLKRHDCLP